MLWFGDLTEKAMESVKAEKCALESNLPGSYRLNTLYQRTGQEIDSLSHQILKDDTIADLEARLERYDNTCMKLDIGGPVALRRSKSLLGTLYNETCILKQRLPDTPTDTRAVHQSKTNKHETGCLQHPACETELERPEITGWQPLQKEFRRRTTEGQWTIKEELELFCSSLEGEPPSQLRAQLGATIMVCQELLKSLERKSQGDGSEKGTHDLQFEEFTDYSKAADVNTLVSKLKEENKQLKQRIAYVENLNSEWQKYDLSREEYVKRLCTRLKESRTVAGVGVGLRVGLAAEPLSSSQLQQEIVRLNCLLDEQMKDCTKLSRELEVSRKEDQERIQTLEQQALIYAEDFKSERLDRERAQGRVQDLQEEVLRLQLKLSKKQERRDPPGSCWVQIGHGMHMQVDQPGADQPGRSSRQLAVIRNNRQGLMDLQCQ